MSNRSDIVASEVVRNDVAFLDVVTEHDHGRRAIASISATLLAKNGHGAGVMGASLEHFSDDLTQHGSTVRVE
jgi:hypothetical protein